MIVSNRKVSNALFHAAEKDVCISSFLFKHSEIIEQKLGKFSKHLGYLGSGLSFVDDLSEGHSVANATMKVGTNIFSSYIGGESGELIGGVVGNMIGGPVGAVVGIAVGYVVSTRVSSLVNKLGNRIVNDMTY